ncbi:phage holin family protein [Methanobacterium sp. ACI-7]|uniref:phage holin family protein n=1 Tax=unclassified Methanobacterium TaxID=2627676 RepID=UPI0039C456BD
MKILENNDISLRLFISRTLVLWIAGVLGLLLITYIDNEVSVDSIETAFLVVGIIGILNALLWPILTRYTLPFLITTFGAGILVLNALVLWLTGEIVDGFTLSGFAYITTPIVMAAITTLISTLLTIDDEAYYFRSVLSRRIQKNPEELKKSKPGVIFTEIDGLAAPILEEAIDKGYMPTLKRWLEEENYKISEWEPDLSSQTGASQAGILHGNNKNMPAFRWVEKENGNKIVASNGPGDAPVLEARISDGNGLLAINGASRSNLFSGDARDVIFTYSKLKNLKLFYNKSWYYFYAYPSNFSRTIALYFYDLFLEIFSRIRQRIKNIQPRLKRGFVYLFVRPGANVFMREVTTFSIVGDVLAGKVDILYATYYGYDEIAHHSGTRDADVFIALRQLDKQLKRIESARKYAPRKYINVVLSDHGQSNGATFKQRYGYSLETLVRKLLPVDYKVYSILSSNEDHWGKPFSQPIEDTKGYINNKIDNAFDKTTLLKDNAYKNIKKVSFIRKGLLKDVTEEKVEVRHEIPKSAEGANIIVLASGNLGLIYFTDDHKRFSYEEIKNAYPKLISGLVQHEGIGFIMVRSKEYGPIVIGANGVYYLDTNIIEGDNPLKNFGANAPKHLKRTDSFKYVPDILVNSFYDSKNDEVAAFEELIGSHGGLGGEQSMPFIMHPSDWDLDSEEIIGAEKLHMVLKDQLDKLWNNKSY